MTKKTYFRIATSFIIFSLIGLIGCSKTEEKKPVEITPPTPSFSENRETIKDAYTYAFPIVDNYRILYSYFVDTTHPQYKGDWNQVFNNQRVSTPEDTAMQTPNSDTPYSFVGFDLRAEPLVFTVPKMEKNRYWSIQFIDLYTFNFDYAGTRTTGNDGGNYLLVGPNWKGDTPKGISKVIQSETELGLAFYRTQLFNPVDLVNVKKIQAGYAVKPLSKFLGEAAPAPVAAIDFLKPLSREDQKKSPEFFNLTNFVLQFCPENPSETELMKRFNKINVGQGQTFDTSKLTPEMKTVFEQGMSDSWVDFSEFKKRIDSGEVRSSDSFGTRDYLKNNYMLRMAGAVLGIWGNSKEEAIYPIYLVDSENKPLNAAEHSYTLRFEPGNIPPANAFWSITIYKLPESLLVANKMNRYLLNSPMMPSFKKDPDGGITFYIQTDSPGPTKESNWLPAPQGPFLAVLRIYYPKVEALNGSWKQPGILATAKKMN